MRKIIILLICLIFSSCISYDYDSIPIETKKALFKEDLILLGLGMAWSSYFTYSIVKDKEI